jgi:hypothetical protein
MESTATSAPPLITGRVDTGPSTLEALAIACASRTLNALETRGHLQPHERQHIEGLHLKALEEGKPCEVFETITRLSTVAPREIPDFIAGLGLAVAKTLRERVPLMPNLNRMTAPASFFATFPDLAAAARNLLVPVLYSEDNEVIGLGSVNPIPALQMAVLVVRDVSVETGVTPFTSVVRLDYDTWRTLLEKQYSI